METEREKFVLGIHSGYLGAVSLLSSKRGLLFAIAEERLTRIKCGKGFTNALTYILQASNKSLKDIDLIAIDSSETYEFLKENGYQGDIEVFPDRTKNLACSAYFASPFPSLDENTLVMVADIDGIAFFKGKGNTLSFLYNLKEDIAKRYALMTKKLGFIPSFETGKTMALAALKSEEGVYELQQELEETLIAVVKRGLEDIGANKLAVSGRLALNCVANLKVKEEVKKNFSDFEMFIIPAASDDGIALGLGYQGLRQNYSLNALYLGREYCASEILDSVQKISARLMLEGKKPLSILAQGYDKIMPLTVEKLLKGDVVGWFQSRAEFGPRALGNRSLLAVPWSGEKTLTRKKLNNIKTRESFRPFAPAILKEYAKNYFLLPENMDSPFMLYAFHAKEGKEQNLQGVVHVDGTGRIETVTREQNQIFYDLINEFYKITNIPILLNTSFNRAKEALVETPLDALNCFINTPIDCLVLGDIMIEKSP